VYHFKDFTTPLCAQRRLVVSARHLRDALVERLARRLVGEDVSLLCANHGQGCRGLILGEGGEDGGGQVDGDAYPFLEVE
jgi:hypothetical protein